MKKSVWMICLVASLALFACENKNAEAEGETTGEALGPSGDSPHIDTNREGFKAAGKAAHEIENKQADRNSRADEAIKAGQ